MYQINTTSISLKVLFVMEGRSGYGLQCVNQQISKYKQYKQLSTLYKIEHCMTKITRYKSRFLYPSLITTKWQTQKIKLSNYLNLNTNKKKLLQNLKLHRWAPVDTMWMQYQHPQPASRIWLELTRPEFDPSEKTRIRMSRKPGSKAVLRNKTGPDYTWRREGRAADTRSSGFCV